MAVPGIEYGRSSEEVPWILIILSPFNSMGSLSTPLLPPCQGPQVVPYWNLMASMTSPDLICSLVIDPKSML